MSDGSIWSVLGIAATRDVGDIRRAYAARLKLVNPEDDAEGFRQLRAAYETALNMARRRTLAPALAEGWEPEGLRSDSDDGDDNDSAPPEAPEDIANTGSASSVDYENLWRRLDALVFGAEPPEPKALVAALEAVLFHPKLEDLGAYMAAERRVTALIARGAPRTDPLIAPARARFDWLAQAEQRTANPGVLQAMAREQRAQQEAALAALATLLQRDPAPEEHEIDRALNDVTRKALADETTYRLTEAELCRLVLGHAPRLDPFIGAIAGALGWNHQYFDDRVPAVRARLARMEARRRLEGSAHPLHEAWIAIQNPPGRGEALLEVVKPRRHARIRKLLSVLRAEHPLLAQDIPARTLRAWDGYLGIVRINPFFVAVLAMVILVFAGVSGLDNQNRAALVAAYYPPAALQAGTEGEVVLRCRARYDGQLGACEPVWESAPGHGFAEAAQQMARDGRLRTFNESPHAWERFDADIRFAAARAGRKAAVHITVREHNGQVPEPAEAGRAAPTPSVDFVEVHGSVRLRCLRGANNSVSNCQALSETPPGQGFGDLAVNYAQDGVIDTPTGPPGWIEFTASVRQDVAVNRPAPPRPVVQRLVPDGRVIVSCMVEPRGRMSQCHVLWQSPRNAGLGAIALAGAESGRMTLRHPVTTRQRVNINVPFGVNPPPSPPDSAWAPHPSQGATPGPIPLQLHGQGDADGAGANGGAVNLPPLAPRTQPRPPLGAPASDQTN